MPAAAAAKVRQKSRRRSKSQGRGSERKPNLSVPLPPGGGLPFVLAEQASALLGEAADFFFGVAEPLALRADGGFLALGVDGLLEGGIYYRRKNGL